MSEGCKLLKGYRATLFSIMPELVVEIQSPGQSEAFMIDKAHIYFHYGARIAINVHPDKRVVEVLRPCDRNQFSESDLLLLEDLLPEMSILV